MSYGSYDTVDAYRRPAPMWVASSGARPTDLPVVQIEQVRASCQRASKG